MEKKEKEKDEPKAQFEFEYSDSDEYDTAPDYGNEQYWENRYKDEQQPFDWYFQWKSLSPHLSQFLDRSGKSLVIGCGNSTMSSEMLSDGFEEIYNIDISPTVISQMKEVYKKFPQLIWDVMDCTDLKYEDNTFQSIFDKGTIDALLCNENSKMQISKLLKEVYRVLKPSGKFFAITFGSPSNRLGLLKSVKLNWHLYTPLSFHYAYRTDKNSKTYLYIFEKSK